MDDVNKALKLLSQAQLEITQLHIADHDTHDKLVHIQELIDNAMVGLSNALKSN